MNEEKKTYMVIGQVTIGTDEYRDLIEERIEAQNKASENSSRWMREYSRSNELERNLEKAYKQIERFKSFVNSNADIHESYRNFLFEKEEGKVNDNGN